MAINNRKLTETYILDSIQSLTPQSTENRKLYENRFKGMTDEAFKRFMERLASNQEILMIVLPNHQEGGLSIENNLKIGDKIGHDFFTRVMVVGKDGLPDHLTPIKFMVIDLPVRRFSQTLDKKIRVPKNAKVIDSLTGQVTGDSKGAAITGPEVHILSAMGLEAPLIEALKYRGGDRQGRTAFNGLMSRYGTATLGTLDKYQGGVESTASLRTYLTAAMMRNNL